MEFKVQNQSADSTWEFDRGTNGWDLLTQLDDVRNSEGYLSVLTCGTDPGLYSPPLQIDAGRYAGFQLRMRLADSSGILCREIAQVYWQTDNSEFSEEASLITEVLVDDEWHDYHLPLATNKQWKGCITRLRIDPASHSGLRIDLRAVRLMQPHETDISLAVKEPTRTSWIFDHGAQGWDTVMQLRELRNSSKALSAVTTGNDPAFYSQPIRAEAGDFPLVYLRMCLTALDNSVYKDQGQFYWCVDETPEIEEASRIFETAVDGQWHEYLLPVGEHNYWRGLITRLRLDPGTRAEVRVELAEVQLVAKYAGADLLSRFQTAPNFFIIGAAKSGTTSLYHYLLHHPDVHLSPIKETDYLCDPKFQYKNKRNIENPAEYCSQFACERTVKIKGEASHHYLTNPASAKILKALFPSAKFVIILRNPAERAYSLYHHRRREGGTYYCSFERELLFNEKHKSRLLRNDLLFDSGLYGEQIERYFSLFRRDQFYILTLDRLKSNPAECMTEIFHFLGIRSDFKPELKIHNEGMFTSRWPLIQRIGNFLIKRPPWLRDYTLSLLQKFNTMSIPPMSIQTRAELMSRYREDLDKLYRLTGVRF